ncbi:hypothetical protein [Crassaminicella thermophila]|uniref:hypothetical protein n=1 Tax=Crassaminicella thermophila TaxID=2599308 RepID=UPI00143D9EA9|nr:hypothetical protein [Crassaminicella thermophila]
MDKTSKNLYATLNIEVKESNKEKEADCSLIVKATCNSKTEVLVEINNPERW